jgi:hypothetical protein
MLGSNPFKPFKPLKSSPPSFLAATQAASQSHSEQAKQDTRELY